MRDQIRRLPMSPVPRPTRRAKPEKQVPPPRSDDAGAGTTAEERVARCVATLVYYHRDGYSWQGAKLLHAEAAGFTAWVASSGPGDDLAGRVLASIEAELHDRYGAEDAGRLIRDWRRALGDAAGAAREAGTPHLHR
jgi:hypothetical protein